MSVKRELRFGHCLKRKFGCGATEILVGDIGMEEPHESKNNYKINSI